MARPKRIDFPFCLYHVYSRTNSGDVAFHDHRDQERFLEYLCKYSELFKFRIHAYCLMPNHFHLLLESTTSTALSELMRRLLTAYTVFFNRRHGRHGHLFQGRFKSHVVDKADYLLALTRYIHLNPAKLPPPADPETYNGSSLIWYIRGNEPGFLYTKETLAWFDGDRQKYLEYIRKGMDEDTAPQIIKQICIGGKAFTQRVKRRINYKKMSEARARKASHSASLQKEEESIKTANEISLQVAAYYEISEEILKKSRYSHGKIGEARTVLIMLLREFLPWTMKRITDYLGRKSLSLLSYHTKRFKEKAPIQKTFQDLKEARKKGSSNEQKKNRKNRTDL